MKQKKAVFVGMSGGVDSSVAALRLVREGYDVTGVFIKTWQPEFIACNWEQERLDAMRVCAKLGIPFRTCDATEAYRTHVGEYLIREYKQGNTPNPDIFCNKEVKFGVFLDYALSEGADYIATGHYAQIQNENRVFHLKRGCDLKKDQTYFLWTLTEAELQHILFPVGNSLKSSIRKEASAHGLPTAGKRDSQGICMLGEVTLQDFLKPYIHLREGDVLNENGRVIGKHYGSELYTLGQRQGFEIHIESANTDPYYIIQKDVSKNIIVVSDKIPAHDKLTLKLRQINRIAEKFPQTCSIQFRHGQEPIQAMIPDVTDDTVSVTIENPPTERTSAGQSCVLYVQENCLGGGIIDEITYL